MAYQRLDITDLKTILTAAQVSHIEDGIIQNESDIADNAADIKQNASDIKQNASDIADNTNIIGGTSISTIGDGTLTGAVAELNTDLTQKSNLLSTQTFNVDNQSIPANSYLSVTCDVSRSGYTPLGIIGYRIINSSTDGYASSRCFAYACYLSGTTATMTIRNYHTSDDANVRVYFYILYSAN